MLPNVGFGEIAVVFIIGLVLFGPDKLPKIARGIAEALRAFRDELYAVNTRTVEPSKEKKKEDEPSEPSGV